MKKRLFALVILSFGAFLYGQGIRVDLPVQVTGPNVPSSGGPLPQALMLANATVTVCAHPATINSCSPVTTYTDSTLTTPCPNYSQMVQLPGTLCTNSVGTKANVGFWYAGGLVDYIVTSSYGTVGPLSVTGASGSGTYVQLSQASVQTLLGPLNVPAIYSQADPYINIMAFGAIPNNAGAGATNSTALASAVSQACTLGGGRIHIPAGKFYMNGTLTISCSSVILEGSGYNVNAAPGSALYFPAATTGIKVTADSIEIRDLGIISASTTSGSDYGVWLTTPIFPKIERVYVYNFGSHGFFFDNSGAGSNMNYWAIYDSFALNNRGDGFHWEGSLNVNLNVGKAIGNTAQGNTGWGFWADVVDSSLFTSNTAETNTGGGYQFSNSQSDIIEGNYCEVGTGSTMSLAASNLGLRIWTPLFGACAVTDSATSVGTNQIQYTINSPFYGQPFARQIAIAPTAGTSGHVWRLDSGVANTNDLSVYDGNTSSTWLDFNVALSQLQSLYPVFAPYHLSNSYPTTPSGQGAYLAWNQEQGGATGEADYIVNPGLGVGGHFFFQSNGAGSSKTELAGFDAGGNFMVGTSPNYTSNNFYVTPAGDTVAHNLTINGTCTGCATGATGISGATLGQALIAGSATTATSSKPLAGAGAGLTTGPTSASAGDVPVYTSTAGAQIDSGKPLAGSGSAVVTGPTSSTSGHLTSYTGTAGQTQDSGIASSSVLVSGSRYLTGYSPGTASSSTTVSIGGLGGTQGNFTTGITPGALPLIPVAGTVTGMYVECGTVGTSTTEIFVAVHQLAGSGSVTTTSMVVTVGSAQSANTMYSDTTHTFSVAAGDRVGVRVPTAGSETLANCTVTLTY